MDALLPLGVWRRGRNACLDQRDPTVVLLEYNNKIEESPTQSEARSTKFLKIDISKSLRTMS